VAADEGLNDFKIQIDSAIDRDATVFGPESFEIHVQP